MPYGKETQDALQAYSKLWAMPEQFKAADDGTENAGDLCSATQGILCAKITTKSIFRKDERRAPIRGLMWHYHLKQ